MPDNILTLFQKPFIVQAMKCFLNNLFMNQRYALRVHILKSFLLVAMVGMLISCSDTNVSTTKINPTDEKTLRFDVYTPIGTLDPSVYPATSATQIFPLLYSFLCVPDTSGKLRPDLAERWHYNSADYTWTIYLNQNARFHNGKPVTSMDVKYSFIKSLRLMVRTDMSSIKSISTVSDNTIKIKLNEDDPQFLRKVWDIEIMPKSSGQNIDYYNHPIGSGPFRFVSRIGGNDVLLGAFKEYFRGCPAIDYVVYHFEPEKERSWTRLLAGDTDVIMEISPINFKILQNYNNRFYTDQVVLQAYTILLYNINNPLFSNPAVRTALAYGIDREYIVREILSGAGVVANGPMGVNSPYHNPKVKPLPYDPEKAITLLKQAGWHHKTNLSFFERNGKPFEFTLFVFQEDQIEKKVARYIQLCLNDIDIRVHIKMMPYSELMKKYFRNTQFDAILTQLKGAYRNPKMALNLWAPINNKPAVAGCFYNSDVIKLVHHIFKEADTRRQIPIYQKLDAVIASLQPGTFLFQKKAIDAMSKRFTLLFPFSLSHEGVYRLQYVHLKNE